MKKRGVIVEVVFDVYTRDGEYLGTRPKSFCQMVLMTKLKFKGE